MKRKFTLISTALLLIMSTGCTHRLTDFTVISTKNVPISTHSTSIKKVDKRVKAKDTAHTILFIPLGMPNMKEAIDKAIEQHPGAIGLVDGVVKSSGWSCLLYGQSSYIVEGTPIYEDTTVEELQNQPQQVSSTLSQGSTIRQNSTLNQGSQDNDSFTVLFYHDVKKGDSLTGVAEAYKVSVADIIKWNQLNSSDLIPGTKLRIMLK